MYTTELVRNCRRGNVLYGLFHVGGYSSTRTFQINIHGLYETNNGRVFIRAKERIFSFSAFEHIRSIMMGTNLNGT